MFSRAALSALIAAATLISFQPAAFASDATSVRDHRAKVVVRDHRTTTKVRDHRTTTKVRDHRTTTKVRDHRTATKVRDHRTRNVIRDHRSQRNNEVVVVKVKKFSCGTGYERLRRTGFRSIQIADCYGAKYSYRAHRNNKIFRADMNAYSGRIQLTMLGFAH